MAKFNVKVKIYGWASQEVEAETKEEAIKIAKEKTDCWGETDYLWIWNNNEILSCAKEGENDPYIDEDVIKSWFPN